MKLCLLVVCLGLIIPRFTRFFFYKNPFSGRKMHLDACVSVILFAVVDMSMPAKESFKKLNCPFKQPLTCSLHLPSKEAKNILRDG